MDEYSGLAVSLAKQTLCRLAPKPQHGKLSHAHVTDSANPTCGNGAHFLSLITLLSEGLQLQLPSLAASWFGLSDGLLSLAHDTFSERNL